MASNKRIVGATNIQAIARSESPLYPSCKGSGVVLATRSIVRSDMAQTYILRIVSGP